jgi:hypothetical protein
MQGDHKPNSLRSGLDFVDRRSSFLTVLKLSDGRSVESSEFAENQKAEVCQACAGPVTFSAQASADTAVPVKNHHASVYPCSFSYAIFALEHGLVGEFGTR